MKRILLALLPLAMVGCASVTTGTSQTIKVETITTTGQVITGADCSFVSEYGMVPFKSGNTATVHRSNKDINVSCLWPNFSAAVGRIVSRANAGLAGNLIIGGVIGAVVDHSTGAGYTYPGWIRLVFGQSRVFDRQNEKDDVVVTGQTINEAIEVPAPTVAISPSTPNNNQYGLIATGFARIDDIDAVPYLGDRGRNTYREWLATRTPRAFAIAPNGFYAATSGLRPKDTTAPSDPSERAITFCEQRAKRPCKLYAVNGSVVWVKPVAQTAPNSATATALTKLPEAAAAPQIID